MDNFFAELKRRNVYKVAVAYAVIGWLIAQIATQIFPFLEIPNWVVRLVIVVVAIGFPIALVIAWAFEATPEGIKRTEVADAMPAAPGQKKHAWIYVVVIGAAICIALFFVGRYTAQNNAGAARTELPAKSIAVLPFDNLSRDPDNAYFAEGVQDEILTRLAKVADLKVISRTSTQRFKAAPSDLREIAKQLGVMNILEGSVQKSNDQVRVNVQLINALNDAHLWAEIYDRKLTDIFAVESDIAKTIADTLQAKLTGSEKAMIAAQPTADTTAYELYHKARSFWEKRSGDNIPKAITLFQQAVAADPNYALAYAGLANAYALLPFYTSTRRTDAIPKAKEAALKALQLNSKVAEAHAALGKIMFFGTGDLTGAAREYRRAIELNPNYATAHQWLGNDSLAGLGQFDQAIAEGRRAVDLDPLSPVINTDLGITLYLARRYNEAVAQLRKTIEIDPTFFYPHEWLGLVLLVKGDVPGAIAELGQAKQLTDEPDVLAFWAAAKVAAGDQATGRQTLTELDKIGRYREVLDYFRVPLFLSLNEKEQAFHCLDQSLAEHDGTDLAWIEVEPMLDPLRGDPRFKAFVEKVAKQRTTGASEGQ
jgi:serine/threonine-protein kinase